MLPLTLSDQQKRYIDLRGNPIHANAAQLVLHGPAVKPTGLCVLAFNVAAQAGIVAAPIVSGDALLSFWAGAAAGFAVGDGMGRLLNRIYTFSFIVGERGKSLCIDKKPDEKTPPTAPDILLRARTLRNLLFAVDSAALVMTPFLSHRPSLPAPPNPPANAGPVAPAVVAALLGFLIGQMASNLSHIASLTHRFYKVAKGDWVIVETPKKVEEKKAAPVRGAVFNPG